MLSATSCSVSKGSDFELSYASPVVLKSKGRDQEGVTPHERKQNERSFDGRKRRNRGSSDDEGNISWDGFIDEDLRAGGPGLCQLPAIIKPASESDSVYQRLCTPGNGDMQRVRSILEEHMVDFEGALSLVEQTYQFCPEDGPVLTLSVRARKNQASNRWVQAARSIRSHLNQMGLPHVMVEIADPEAFEATQLSPVHCTDTVFAVWDALREAILQVIDLTGVRILGCYRFGRSSTAHHNPPTVVVIVDFKSTRTWKTTREQIVDILNRIMLPSVAVAVIKDRIRRATFSPEADFTRKVFSSPVLPGQGLGPSDQDQVTGAFGGYVELKFPDGEWHTYGLTCFHCVVPGERYLSQSNPEVRKNLTRWSLNGVSMNDPAAKHLSLDHPTKHDIDVKLNNLKASVAEITSHSSFKDVLRLDPMARIPRNNLLAKMKLLKENQDFIKAIKEIKSRKGNYLGYVAAASGFRTHRAISIEPPPSSNSFQHDSCLDWALIEIPQERHGKNFVRFMGDSDLELMDLDPKYFKDLIGDNLYISGSSSGYSEGEYNALLDANVAEEIVDGKFISKVTLEHSVLGAKGPPPQSKESGALVHSWSSVVGMIFSGGEAMNVLHFTHIHDLFADIKRVTGAEDVRILA